MAENSREEGEIGSGSREKGDLLPCSSPLLACPVVLNTNNFFRKAVNEMVNQQNTRKLINVELRKY